MAEIISFKNHISDEASNNFRIEGSHTLLREGGCVKQRPRPRFHALHPTHRHPQRSRGFSLTNRSLPPPRLKPLLLHQYLWVVGKL